MKILLGSLFAALLIVPFALSAQQAPATTTGDAIAHCGKCDKKKKCKDGCDCGKCKKAGEEKKDGEVLLADEGKCKKGKCKKKDGIEDALLLADEGKCKKGKCKKKDGTEDALLLVA